MPFFYIRTRYFILTFFIISLLISIYYLIPIYLITDKIKQIKGIRENSILKQLINPVNYGNFVPVRINLGQDELKEIDILSLVAKNTQQTYKKWSFDIFFSPRQFVGNVVYYALITAITALVFYNSSSYGVTQSWREKSGFCQYFPSQAVIDMDFISNQDTNAVNTLASCMIEDDVHIESSDKYIDVINRKFFKGNETIKLLSYKTTKRDSTNTIKQDSIDKYTDSCLKITHEVVIQHPVYKSLSEAIKDSILNFQAVLLKQLMDKKDVNTNDLDLLNNLLNTPSVLEGSSVKISLQIGDSCKNSRYKHQLLEMVEHAAYAQEASTLRQFCIGTDMFIQTSYNRFKKHFTNGVLPEKAFISFILESRKDNKHGFIPPFLDYWFIILLSFVFLFVNFISRFSYVFGIRTPRYVINLLDNLVENIDAQVLIEKTGQVPTMNTSGSRIAWFSFRRQKTIPRLDAKAIENQLIYIMDEIDRIPNFVVKPKFIFIFDELDKIEPYFNPSVAAREKEDVENVRIEGSRMRQELVVKILGNLKHFLRTCWEI